MDQFGLIWKLIQVQIVDGAKIMLKTAHLPKN
jgi:hypothetical protein